MNGWIVMLLAIGACVGLGCGQALSAGGSMVPTGTVRVFILAGQSNMGGAGKAEHLFAQQRKTPANVRLWQDGQFRELVWRATFGPEVGLVDGLTKAGVTGPVVLVKLGPGGTHLHGDWDPTGTVNEIDGKPTRKLYPKLLAEINAATTALKTAGQAYRFCGLFWMQGERDCRSKRMADSYRKNLARLIGQVRKDTGTPDLPAVVGRIAPRMLVNDLGPCVRIHTHREIIRSAQEAVAASDPRVGIVDTDDLPQFDNLHYDAAGQMALGRRFAREYLDIISP